MKRLCALAAILALASPAAANEYETFIDVQSEDDLYDLYDQGEISEQTLEAMVDLLQRGVNLNRADRAELYTLPNLTYGDVDAILAYRDEVGGAIDPAALVASGVLDAKKLMAIAPFILADGGLGKASTTDGWIRSQSRMTVSDRIAPPVALQGRVSHGSVRVGAASALTRNRIGQVIYDPSRNALTATGETTRVEVPKAYIEWNGGNYSGLVGTYRAGFAQRLTFDNTNQVSPNGFYRDDQLFRDTDLTNECKESSGELGDSPCPSQSEGSHYITPDYRWRPGLLGVAVAARRLTLGKLAVDATAFGSLQSRPIYQYELYDRGQCSDPRDDDTEMPGNVSCAAPSVFRTGDDPFMPASKFSFQTLPDMYRETLAGGNVTVHTGARSHVGVTGYGAQVAFLTQGIDLDFQEWSPMPFGGPFGAVGVDGGIGLGNTNVFAEVTRTFDSEPGAGGFAAVARGVTNWGRKNELETSVRYYDDEFANPYARPIAQADEYEGNRARNEAGFRVRYTGKPLEDLTLRTSADLWVAPTTGVASTQLFARGDYEWSGKVTTGVWAAYQNKDLERNGRSQCYEVSDEEDESGEPIACAGQKSQVALRLRLQPNRHIYGAVQIQHSMLDEAGSMSRPQFDHAFRHDLSGVIALGVRPMKNLLVRARTRYLSEDVKSDDYLEESLLSYLDVVWRVRPSDRLRVRYDLAIFLDDRQQTLLRTPSPEHAVWFEYEARF